MKEQLLIENLLEEISELKEGYNQYILYYDIETVNNYHVMNDLFVPFLIAQLSDIHNEGLLYRLFDFIERMALSDDFRVKGLLAFSILKRLSEDSHIFKNARYFMREQTKLICEEIGNIL